MSNGPVSYVDKYAITQLSLPCFHRSYCILACFSSYLQDCLGYDRHGRKYWFIARRIFVEETSSRQEFEGSEIPTGVEKHQTWYYSSPHQFEQLLAVLDKTEFERALCQELYNLRPEIIRQMNITVQLTNELKGRSLFPLNITNNKLK